jgi:hypothetical protein
MAIVFILAKLKVAYYVSRTGGGEVDIRRVECHDDLGVRSERCPRTCKENKVVRNFR